jgi:hypothetical protein
MTYNLFVSLSNGPDCGAISVQESCSVKYLFSWTQRFYPVLEFSLSDDLLHMLCERGSGPHSVHSGFGLLVNIRHGLIPCFATAIKKPC